MFHNHKRTVYLLLSAILCLLMVFTGCRETGREQRLQRFFYDDDGMLVLEGQRTFMIGSYHLPKSETPYAVLRNNGFNLVRLPANTRALDMAEKHGLWGWLGTGYINTAAQDSSRILGLIDSLKSHKALLIWEIADEPAFTWNAPDLRIAPEKMYETWQLIKSTDPLHLVYTNHGPVNLVSTLQKYNRSTDIIACDVYPVIPNGIKPTYALFADGLQGDLLNPYISQVGEYTDKMRRVGGKGKPLFMVLQGFSWEMLKDVTERDTAMIRYPTREESRFMAYHSIIHGANGINYWGMDYTPQPSQFMEDLYKVTKELAEMQPVLSARSYPLSLSKTYLETGHSVDSGVEILAKKVNGDLYLLTVNADKNPVKITLGNFESFQAVEVLGEGRFVPVLNGEITLTYQPFESHILKFKTIKKER